MVIRKIQKQIATREKQIGAYRKKVEAFRPRVKVPARFLRGAVKQKGKVLTPLAKRQQIRQEYTRRGALKETERAKVRGLVRAQEAYKKKFKRYLYSPEGKLQYAKEFGLKGRPVYAGVLRKDGTIERRMTGYEYKTPYGKVTDYSVEVSRQRDLARAWRKEQAKLRKKLKLPKGKVVVPFAYALKE